MQPKQPPLLFSLQAAWIRKIILDGKKFGVQGYILQPLNKDGLSERLFAAVGGSIPYECRETGAYRRCARMPRGKILCLLQILLGY